MRDDAIALLPGTGRGTGPRSRTVVGPEAPVDPSTMLRMVPLPVPGRR
jgi:hypothetical protein